MEQRNFILEQLRDAVSNMMSRYEDTGKDTDYYAYMDEATQLAAIFTALD